MLLGLNKDTRSIDEGFNFNIALSNLKLKTQFFRREAKAVNVVIKVNSPSTYIVHLNKIAGI